MSRNIYTAKLLQSCPTLCDPIDGSPPGSPVPGILQARTLEWVAIAFFEYVLNAALRKELRIFTKASGAGAAINSPTQ